MHVWLRKLLQKSRVASPCRDPTQHEQDDRNSRKIRVQSSSSSSSSLASSSSSTKPPQSVLSSPLRLSKTHDVFVCNSSADADVEEATRLVSFLEGSGCDLRCFLWQRDATPGAAIPTELCQAVQDSHCKALLITPDFLQDEWCKYMMHQALAEAPMSNRMIPLLHNLSHAECPQELRFFYCIDLSKDPDRGYAKVNVAVRKYLEDAVEKEKTLNMDSSSRQFDNASSLFTGKPNVK